MATTVIVSAGPRLMLGKRCRSKHVCGQTVVRALTCRMIMATPHGDEEGSKPHAPKRRVWSLPSNHD
jgi:hypothetical protein